MQSESHLGLWVALWLATAATISLWRWRKRAVGTGLVPAYLVNFAMLYWLAAAMYLLPAYEDANRQLLEAGFQQATYAIVAFGVGSLILAPYVISLFHHPQFRILSQTPELRLPRAYIMIGLLSYFIAQPLLGRVPTVSAVVAAGWSLLMTGLCLACWRSWHERRSKDFVLWLIVALGLPFLTTISQGFLGIGIGATIVVLTFVGTFYRPWWRVLAVGLILGYAGLSLYVSYARDRTAIREAVWGGGALSDRLQRVYDTVSMLEPFDPNERAHFQRVDGRLNQSLLIGSAIDYLEVNAVRDFGRGETLWQALIALVPRAIWPDKPVVAGSMTVVSDYTGRQFDRNTSVGVGHVMEFYINFGTLGVVLGFLVLGVAVTALDRAAGVRLRRGDWKGFALWFLPGLSLLQVGGSLVELTSSAGAAVIAALLVNRLLLGEPAERFSARGGPGQELSPMPRQSDALMPRGPGGGG